jgi:UTP--glucose-1-phosphate uridylyltransferase
MSKVRKAIIPAAGLGTRFLPATKTVPKEMLTIVDAPVIFYVVEEAVKAGIEDIILVQGRNKEAIEDFFDTSYELEDTLAKTGKLNLLERLIKIREMANIISVRQKQPLGLGHAVLCAERIVGQEPFAVLLGDEITLPANGYPTSTEQLAKLFNESKASTVSVRQVADSEVSKYGIADVEVVQENYFRVRGFVEKPSPSEAPSRWALPGRYVLTPQIFEYLKNAKPGKNGEIQLTDSLNELAKKQDFFASAFLGERFDAGDKLGYIQANVELGLRNAELAEDLKKFILQIAKRLES